MKKLSKEEFIEKFKSIYGDLYDYSKSNFINSNIKIRIKCDNHGYFELTPKAHMTRGCPKCSGNCKLTTEGFTLMSIKIHGKRYDYSLVDYKNNKTNVKIICREHGIFEQMPCVHLKKHGCPKCFHPKKYTQEEIIKKFKDVHNEDYDYSLVDYVNVRKNVKIICKKHDVFNMKPDSHYNKKYGCPFCKKSKGENEVENILKDLNIEYIRQKKFENCKNKYLRFQLNRKNATIFQKNSGGCKENI